MIVYLIGGMFILSNVYQIIYGILVKPIVLLDLPLSILGIWAGIGLLNRNNSARQFAMVIMVCSMILNFMGGQVAGILINSLILLALVNPTVAENFKK